MLPFGYRPEIVCGKEGYALLASLPEVDMVLSAQVGAAGLRATVAAAGETMLNSGESGVMEAL